MARYCCECSKLNSKKEKKPGLYFCSAKKDFTCASKLACENYNHGYVKKSDRDALYNKGVEASKPKDSVSLGGYFFLLIFVIIMAITLKILGY